MSTEHVERGPQISEGPQNARQEKMASTEELQNREMMKLYRQHVLKEETVNLVQIGSAPKPKVDVTEDELVAGD